MKLVLTIILFIILMCSCQYMFEDFTSSSITNQATQSGLITNTNQTTQSGLITNQTTQSGLITNTNQTTQSGSNTNQTTQSGLITNTNQTTQASSGKVSYFELNNEAQNLVNAHKNEVALRELQHEEEGMRNNVRKIVNHAHNVLSFIDLNKDYLERNLQSGGSK